MMTEQRVERFNQMRAKALSIAEKAEVSEPIYSRHRSFEGAPQNLVTVLREGRLRGQLIGAWIPVRPEMVEKEPDAVKERSLMMWRSIAAAYLFPPELYLGPKGKLPV